jgi:hypothetical protein
MKKEKYYYINSKGEKILVRTSANEYKYALVYKDAVDNKGTIKCSAKLEAVQKEFEWRTKGFPHNCHEKVNGRYLFSSQFENPDRLAIVELIKG